MTRNWTTPEGLAFEDQQTGDGRLFVAGSFYWDDQPNGWPLRADLEDDGWHAGAVLVGTITTMDRSGSAITGTGTLDDGSEAGAEVARMLDEGAPLGISVDMDDMEVEFVATDMEEEDGAAVLLAASLPQATLTWDHDGHLVEFWAPELRSALVAAGMGNLVAAAGDGDPEDGVVLFTDSMDSMIVRCTRARIRGATLVDIPAFHRAAIALDPAGATSDEPVEEDDAIAASGGAALTAAVTGAADLPLAARDTEWDGSAAQGRMAGDGDEIDQDQMAAGHFWRDDDADPATVGAYSLPFADVIDGTLTAVPEGIFAVASVLQGGRGGVDIPDEDQETIRGRVEAYYERMADEFDDDTIVVPWADDSAGDDEPAPDSEGDDAARSGGCTTCPDAMPLRVRHRPEAPTPALTAAGTPIRPPRAWFADPQFTQDDTTEVEDPETGRVLRGVPMRYITEGPDRGRVLGHIGLWGQCHTGSAEGQCVMTPRSASGYTWFRHGHVITAEGDHIATGNLTLGGGHADVRLSYRAALNHYDDVSTQVAQLVAGEDRYGVWVAGAGMPDVWDDELTMRRLRAASPSGDWRWIGGALELSIAHCVNGPGFPVPRAQVASGGEVVSLVAAGARAIAQLNREATADVEVDVEALIANAASQAATAAVAAFVAQQNQAATAAARRRLREASITEARRALRAAAG